MAKRKPEIRTTSDTMFWHALAVVCNGSILTYFPHDKRPEADELAKYLRGHVDEVPAKVYDHRLDLNAEGIQQPDIDERLFEIVETVEFRVSAKGEPYYCRYRGFALVKSTDTNGLLYFIKPPRFGQTEIIYSKPAEYWLEDDHDD